MSDKGPIGKIELSERYDNEDDVYYVTARTGEPSVVEEFDDRLLLEIGIFTRMPTGFRILNYSKHRADAAQFKKTFLEICRQAGLSKLKESETWKRRDGQALEKVA